MRGDYNANSALQKSAIALTAYLLKQALESIDLPNILQGDEPFTVGDLGASHGKNSLQAMNLIIEVVRAKDPSRHVKIIHTDLPGNDFGALFQTLQSEESYLKKHKDIFTYVAG